MARYLGPRCRICRRLGVKLMLKANRCLSEKCALEKRKSPPGPKPMRPGKATPYGLQLKEKQKLKKSYHMLEKQFRNFFEVSSRRKGVTGDNLLQMLETRLDNVVYRLNFADSRPMARQLVLHGHILVNNKKVDVASYRVKVGDVITVKEASRQMRAINQSLGASESRSIVAWLILDVDNYKGTVDHLPLRAEIEIPANEQTVVELYSK
jgi:small subunit ribosomal protein S4